MGIQKGGAAGGRGGEMLARGRGTSWGAEGSQGVGWVFERSGATAEECG